MHISARKRKKKTAWKKKDTAYFSLFFKIHAFLDTTPVWIHLYYICALTGGVGKGWRGCDGSQEGSFSGLNCSLFSVEQLGVNHKPFFSSSLDEPATKGARGAVTKENTV